MNNYVQYIKNELDDASIELSRARCNLRDIARYHGALSGPYADSLAETMAAVQKLIESLKEQVEDSLEPYVEEEFPIKEEDE